jgi:hypothetical protein
MNEPTTLALLSELLQLMLRYEAELTAYHQVFQHMERKTVQAGHEFTGWVGVRRILADPRVAIEASVCYANCLQVLQVPSPKNLEAALAEIRNLTARRNQDPSLDPLPSDDKSPVN